MKEEVASGRGVRGSEWSGEGGRGRVKERDDEEEKKKKKIMR